MIVTGCLISPRVYDVCIHIEDSSTVYVLLTTQSDGAVSNLGDKVSLGVQISLTPNKKNHFHPPLNILAQSSLVKPLPAKKHR